MADFSPVNIVLLGVIVGINAWGINAGMFLRDYLKEARLRNRNAQGVYEIAGYNSLAGALILLLILESLFLPQTQRDIQDQSIIQRIAGYAGALTFIGTNFCISYGLHRLRRHLTMRDEGEAGS